MQEIVDQIKVYINEKKSDYAIMINGSWGCGKTYFVKNCLSYELFDKTHKPNIYISLFGINSTEDLYDLLAINILDIKNNQNADKKSIMIGSKVDKREYYRLVSLTKEAIAVKKGMKELLTSFSLGKTVSNITRHLSETAISFRDYVFILDDFERAEIDKTELLAFIDSLVEQSNAKVIVVCNEYSLLQKTEKRDIKNNILSPDKKSLKKQQVSKLIKIVLPNSSKNDNADYLKYKEKVIGLTISFKYDIAEVFDNILNDYIDSNSCREFITGHKERILDLFRTAQSNNLRTLEFIFRRFSEIFCRLSELNYEPDYSEQYFSIILDNIVASSIHYREKSKLLKYKDDKYIASRVWTKNGFGSHSIFSPILEEIITWRAIDEYIISYYIDVKILKDYIDDHIKHLNSDTQSISMLLFNILFIDDDRKACEALKTIQFKIYNNVYDINVYPHILDRLFKLYKLLPVDDNIDNLKECILKNAESQCEAFSKFSWNTFEYEDKDANVFKDELYRFVKEKFEHKQSMNTKEILDSDELFAKQINYIFKNNESLANTNKGYFAGLSGEKFAKRLLKLPLKDIRSLNSNLQYYYLDLNTPTNKYTEDYQFLSLTAQSLKGYLEAGDLEIKPRTKYLLSYTLKILCDIVRHMQNSIQHTS